MPGDRYDFLKEMNHYFMGSSQKIQLKIKPQGTIIQEKIWKAISTIPYGKTVTYKELGQKLGIHPRIIGMGCRTNPIPIIIPCHRVISTDPKKIYYSFGKGAETKNWLLEHEAEKNCV